MKSSFNNQTQSVFFSKRIDLEQYDYPTRRCVHFRTVFKNLQEQYTNHTLFGDTNQLETNAFLLNEKPLLVLLFQSIYTLWLKLINLTHDNYICHNSYHVGKDIIKNIIYCSTNIAILHVNTT